MSRTSAYYEGFASVYDLFQDNVDYVSWSRWLVQELQERGCVEGDIVLDLGCGTGIMTELLSGAGYDMIGVDNSEEMLQEAFEKRQQSGHLILYLLQDMQSFELYGTVKAVVSVCDCLNYLLEEEELLTTFRLVNNYLDPGGVFIFDMKTAYHYGTVLGNATIAENREEASFIWENDYDPETGINTYDLTLFLPREDGLYEKDEELHCQRAYPQEVICELLEEAGLRVEAVYDAYSCEPPTRTSERLTFIAREQTKKQVLESAVDD